MFWIILLLVIVFIAFGFSKEKSSDKAMERKPVAPIGKTSKQIENSIVTREDYCELKKEWERAHEIFMNLLPDEDDSIAHRNIEIVENALMNAGEKIVEYQFCPYEDFDTPLFKLEHAYEVYDKNEYKEMKKILGNEFWEELRMYDEPDERPDSIDSYIDLRRIVESSDDQDKKIKKINDLVENDCFLSEEFYKGTELLTPGDLWFAYEYSELGLPMAEKLFEMGYNTPEKILDINPNDFRKLKGIGPKKQDQLIEFQKRITTKKIF